MSKFIIIPKFRSEENINVSYNAPSMIIDAQNHNEAVAISKNSGLGRFKEWSFHIAPFLEKKKHNAVSLKKEIDKNSKSQLGKSIAGHGHTNSRPVRRALKRLSMKKNNQSGSHHKGGAMKMW